MVATCGSGDVFHTAAIDSNGTLSPTILIDILSNLCHAAFLVHGPAGLTLLALLHPNPPLRQHPFASREYPFTSSLHESALKSDEPTSPKPFVFSHHLSLFVHSFY